VQDGSYTDLQTVAGVSRNYTEMQSREAVYHNSNIDDSDHAYENTDMQA